MKFINKKTGQPYKVLWFGDMVVPSGFGRIGNEVLVRLKQRGYDVQAVGFNYTGWPHGFPFWVWPIVNADLWNTVTTIVNQTKPDILISCQDFPYHTMLYTGCRIDFSRLKWIWITPIDGTPIHPDWLKAVDWADAGMVISRFGVEAMRQEGKRVDLCHPGVNASEFYPADADEKKAMRAHAKYDEGDFVVGVVCMNQGRKAIAPMIEAFHEFARDKPNARLYLDMDKLSGAGWDIPNLLKSMRWTDDEQKRVKYKEDMFKEATDPLAPLRNRYMLMDAHMVISHREGFGMPLLESMACRIPTIALDWCSGTEIVGDGRGFLVPRTDYMEYGTWGGARDAFPNVPEIIAALNRIYNQPVEAAAIAERGYQWAVQQTWDVTADQVEAVIQRVIMQERRSHEPISATPSIGAGLSDVGGRDVAAPVPAVPVRDHSELQRAAMPDSMPALYDYNGDGGRESREIAVDRPG